MSLPDILLLLLAGFGAGTLNALAGGGTFLSFPALLAVGLPPVTANATNAIALWPASLTSAWAARASLRSLGRYLPPLLAAGLLGGLAGSLLLLISGDERFRQLIPWLLLLATLLFAISPWLSRIVTVRYPLDRHSPAHRPLSLCAHLGVSLYGGYFGAGMGILQLAAFAIEGHPPARANALKNLIATMIYSSAAITFILAGRVSWPELGILLAGSLAGGYAGGALGERLPARWLRLSIILVGTGMTLYYFRTTCFSS